jgi:flagellar L-ring protein FlgH
MKTNAFKFMSAEVRRILFGSLFAILVPCTGLATSLWDENANGGRSLFTDRKAFRVGDLVTIVVNLTTTAVKDQNTDTTKEVSVQEEIAAIIGPLVSGERAAAELTRRNPHNTWEASNTFSGSGSVNNTESMTATIQARVTDVLPNKVLRIQATRKVEFGQEKSDIVMTGFVRQEDLTTANTVLSTQVADLELKQVTNGAISRVQKKGWLTRVWENISPF